MISKHILLPIDEYTLRKRIIEVIPSTIWNSLIDLKGLSTSTLSVAEWVEAIARHERELLEKAAFNDTFTNPTRFGTATTRRQPARVPQLLIAQQAIKANQILVMRGVTNAQNHLGQWFNPKSPYRWRR
jgi:hypothetical protein